MNGTGKVNEKKKRRGLVKKPRGKVTTPSDTTASLEEEAEAGGDHDESSEVEAEIEFDEDGLNMGMGMNMNMGGMNMGTFHGDAAMSGMMGMGMMSTMAVVMGGMGMGMYPGASTDVSGNVGVVMGARGRRAVRGSGGRQLPMQNQMRELDESMEVDEESLRGRTFTRGSGSDLGAGSGVEKRVDGHLDGASCLNGNVRLKEERIEEMLGGGQGLNGMGLGLQA